MLCQNGSKSPPINHSKQCAVLLVSQDIDTVLHVHTYLSAVVVEWLGHRTPTVM